MCINHIYRIIYSIFAPWWCIWEAICPWGTVPTCRQPISLSQHCVKKCPQIIPFVASWRLSPINRLQSTTMPNGTFVHQDPWAQGEKYKNAVGMIEVTWLSGVFMMEKCSFRVERCFAFTEKGMGLAFSSAPYLLKIGETVPPEEGLSSARSFCQF